MQHGERLKSTDMSPMPSAGGEVDETTEADRRKEAGRGDGRRSTIAHAAALLKAEDEADWKVVATTDKYEPPCAAQLEQR